MSVFALIDKVFKRHVILALLYMAVQALFWYLAIEIYPPWFLKENYSVITHIVSALSVELVWFHFTGGLMNQVNKAAFKREKADGDKRISANISGAFVTGTMVHTGIWVAIFLGIEIVSFKQFLWVYFATLIGFWVILLLINNFSDEDDTEANNTSNDAG